MATFTTFWFWFFLLFFSFSSLMTTAQPRVNHLQTFCNNQSGSFTKDSFYHSNRRDVFTFLRATTTVESYLSVTKGTSPDTVYAMYHCRADVNRFNCGRCVRSSVTEIIRTCTNQKEAFVYYEECMVRYSDYSFFGLLETSPKILISSPSSFPIQSRFGQTLSGKMDKLITRAASTILWPKPYLAMDQQSVMESDSSYVVDSMAQCSPDLDPGNCTACLRLAVHDIVDCCSRSRSVLNFLPKCLVKYNTSSLPFKTPTQTPMGSLGVIKGKKMFERTFSAIITASALALVGL